MFDFVRIGAQMVLGKEPGESPVQAQNPLEARIAKRVFFMALDADKTATNASSFAEDTLEEVIKRLNICNSPLCVSGRSKEVFVDEDVSANGSNEKGWMQAYSDCVEAQNAWDSAAELWQAAAKFDFASARKSMFSSDPQSAPSDEEWTQACAALTNIAQSNCQRANALGYGWGIVAQMCTDQAR